MKVKIKRGLRATATLGATALVFSAGAAAADKELLDMLVKNGAINKTQYDTLLKKADISKEDAAKMGNVVTTLDNKGMKFETTDKNFEFTMRGRLHADAVNHGDGGRTTDAGRIVDGTAAGGAGNDANDGVGIRRARMEFAGKFYKNVAWRMQYEFANNTKPLFKDMWIAYTGWDLATITVGEQKRPFSLQQMMSSNDMMFTERGWDYAFTAPLERATGLRLDSNGKNWSAAVGVFGDSINGNANGDTVKNDQGWSTAGRATWAPYLEKDQVLHVGMSGSYTKTEDSVNDGHGKARFKVSPTGSISDLTLFDTGHMSNIRDYTNVGVEAAGIYGPFSAEAEYTRSYVAREDKGITSADPNDLTFDGWHMDAHYSITGESRHYDAKTGTFGRVKPNRNFDMAGGWGAWELAGRIMQIDMSDKNFRAGRGTASSFGLNWNLNPNLRLMADYTHVWDIDNPMHNPGNAAKGKDPANLDYAQLRASLAF